MMPAFNYQNHDFCVYRTLELIGACKMMAMVVNGPPNFSLYAGKESHAGVSRRSEALGYTTEPWALVVRMPTKVTPSLWKLLYPEGPDT